MKEKILMISDRLKNGEINIDESRRELLCLFGVPTKFLVLKDHNNLKKDTIYKECYSTDGKNQRYYTTGQGDIVRGDFSKHPDIFEEL